MAGELRIISEFQQLTYRELNDFVKEGNSNLLEFSNNYKLSRLSAVDIIMLFFKSLKLKRQIKRDSVKDNLLAESYQIITKRFVEAVDMNSGIDEKLMINSYAISMCDAYYVFRNGGLKSEDISSLDEENLNDLGFSKKQAKKVYENRYYFDFDNESRFRRSILGWLMIMLLILVLYVLSFFLNPMGGEALIKFIGIKSIFPFYYFIIICGIVYGFMKYDLSRIGDGLPLLRLVKYIFPFVSIVYLVWDVNYFVDKGIVEQYYIFYIHVIADGLLALASIGTYINIGLDRDGLYKVIKNNKSSTFKPITDLIKDSSYSFAIKSFGIVLLLIICLDMVFLPSFGDVLVEAHGLLFDILLFGLVIAGYDYFISKKREAKRYEEELDDYRGWIENEAKFRVSGILRRLVNSGVSGINYTGLHLGETDQPIILKALATGSHIGSLDGAKFENCEIKGFIAGLKFTNCSFKNVKFLELDLRSSDFSNSQFVNVEFRAINGRHSKFNNSYFENVFFYDSDFSESKLESITCQYVCFTNNKFKHTSFNKLNGNTISFSNCDLYQTSFDQLAINNLRIVDGTKFRYPNIRDVEVDNIVFENSILESVWFIRGRMSKLRFKDSIVKKMRFRDCILVEPSFKNIIFEDKLEAISWEGMDKDKVSFENTYTLKELDDGKFMIVFKSPNNG